MAVNMISESDISLVRNMLASRAECDEHLVIRPFFSIYAVLFESRREHFPCRIVKAHFCSVRSVVTGGFGSGIRRRYAL